MEGVESIHRFKLLQYSEYLAIQNIGRRLLTGAWGMLKPWA